MFLKPDRRLFRERRTVRWVRWVAVLGILSGALYAAYSAFSGYAEPLMRSATPTPMPTATPSAGYYAALAEEAYWDGSVSAAISGYQRSLDLDPHQTELYLELARLMIYNGQAERGLEMARQALTRQPENGRAWALLGLAYDWLGLTKQAVAYCQKAVELAPTLPEAYAYLAEAYVDDGQWFAANEVIATALELDPTNVDVLRNRAYVLENQGNYSGAIQAYREAIAVNDKLVHLYLAIGRNAGALGNLTVAQEAYSQAIAADPAHAEALARLGWTQILMGDYSAARPNLAAALEADPNLADAYGYLGTLHFHQRNYEDAIVAFGPAIDYAEARSRRRTVQFTITLEDAEGIDIEPRGSEVAIAEFIHPADLQTPMRGQFRAVAGGPGVGGHIRFDVLSGRYEAALTGLPPAPSGKAYIGWFQRLLSPESTLVRTAPIYPAPDGRANLTGTTGHVKGPAIEHYYSFALSYYLLDECEKAVPLIEVALRINPQDENALKTLELCR